MRELSARLGFSPSAVQRILYVLKAYGFVRQDPKTRRYSLGNISLSFFLTLQDKYPITEVEQLIPELALIRERGYSSSLGETSQGLGTLSVPLSAFYSGTFTLAAVSLAIPEIRFNNYDHRKLCIEELLLVSKEFSETTRYYGED